MSKKFLIVVDVQNGFVTDEQTEKVAKRIEKLLQNNLFDVVIASQFRNVFKRFEELLDWHEMINDDESTALYGKIREIAKIVLIKNTYTCVDEVLLQTFKIYNGGNYPSEIFLVGIDTDCCVLKTAVDLLENNIRPVVLTQYCASSGGAKAHEAGLKCLERLIGENQLCDLTLNTRKDVNQIESNLDF